MQMTAQQIREIIAEKIKEGDVIPCHNERGHRYKYTPTGAVNYSVTTKNSILDSPHIKAWAAGLAAEHIDRNWQSVCQNKGVSDELRKAAVMAHNDVFEDAGQIGTLGHEVAERYMIQWMETGIRPENIIPFIIGEDVRLYAIARSFEQFCIDFDIEPIASELLVINEKEKYGGTLDALMFVTKIIEKGDGSCSSEVHDWWETSSGKKRCGKCRAKGKKIFALVDIKTSNQANKPEYAMQVSAYWYALAKMTGLRPTEILILQLDKKKMKYNVMRILNKSKAYSAFKYVAKVFDWLEDGQSKIVPYKVKQQVFLD